MAWAPYAMAAAPTLLSMFQPKPQMPGPSPVNNIRLPDRSGYQDQILQSGFNPQSELYRLASERAMADMNHQMVNRGLANSSMGNMAMSQGQADLANKFLENELQRRVQAFQAATGYDVQSAQVQSGLAQAQSQDAWMRYQAELGNGKAGMAGLTNLAGLGAGAYGAMRDADAQSLANDRSQANFNRFMGAYERAPTGGYVDNSGMGPTSTMSLSQPRGY